MRQAGRCLLLVLGVVLAAPAAEGGPAHLTLWKLANFALFAGLLGYVLRKKAGLFFSSRAEQIRKAIAEAARFREDAEARYAAIEQRLAGLGAEIKSLRSKAREEAAAELERSRQTLDRELKKIQAEAEREIATAFRDARQQLRAEAAELAVRLASGTIRQRLTPEVEDRIVISVAGDLERRAGLGIN